MNTSVFKEWFFTLKLEEQLTVVSLLGDPAFMFVNNKEICKRLGKFTQMMNGLFLKTEIDIFEDDPVAFTEILLDVKKLCSNDNLFTKHNEQLITCSHYWFETIEYVLNVIAKKHPSIYVRSFYDKVCKQYIENKNKEN